jgi:hypothetical protein
MASVAIRPVNWSTAAALRQQVGDRVTRELKWPPLNRPGRGVPPPRSGPPPLVVVTVKKNHALLENSDGAGGAL